MSKNDDSTKNGKGKLDFSKFKIPSESSDLPVTQKVLLHVPVRKPSKQQFVRVCSQEFGQFECAILKLEDDDRPYLVSPEIAQMIISDVKMVTLKLTMDRQGNVLLWPIPPRPIEGNDNIWNETQRDAAKLAENNWIRLTSNRDLGCYQATEARGEYPEPVWPELTMDEILTIAFGSTHVIMDQEHPALQKLWGLE